MRILITHHFPLGGSATGRLTRELAVALGGAGHEVHLLVVADVHAPADDGLVAERVTCGPGNPAADLDFDVPWFDSEAAGRQTFDLLSEEQLAAYREALRQKLDREVDRFDPHIIHVEHLWLLGQLALETGVPYVVSAWGPELASCAALPRLRGLAQQAAENAGRILVPDAALAKAVRGMFEVGAERLLVLPADSRSPEPYAQLYRTVLEERFGRPPAE
jgi:hypothetical protein